MAPSNLLFEPPWAVLSLLKYVIALPFLALLLYLVQNEIVRYQSRIKNLPGPRGWPVVGNLFQIHNAVPASKYQEWASSHGPVFQVQLGNTPAVVINTTRAARELFLGQTHAMNSRPTFYVMHKKVSAQVTSIGTTPWGDSCKKRRKLAAGALNKVRVASYGSILNLEAREFLRDLLAESGGQGSVEIDFRPAIRRFALNLSLTLNYGTRVSSVKSLTDDSLLSEVVYVESQVSRLRDTAKNYANYIPLLRLWEPVAGFLGLNKDPKGHAADIGRRRLAYNNGLLEKLKSEVERDVDQPCIQGSVLRNPDSASLTREELISVSLSMMAGADSNQPTMAWACLLLAHRPDIQAKAYAMIQEAGVLDLPSDEYASTRVEYVDAFTKEISRYFVVLRLALPKATYADVKWMNATIPANTLVFLNSWACNRDPELFTDPHTFAPERWMPGGVNEHAHQYAFGMGGRSCVAQNLAHRALYTVFLHLIAHYHILPAEGETVEAIDPMIGMNRQAFTAEPKGWRARFVPRNPERLPSWLEGK